MATYEYSCQECKHEWEEIQSMKDDPITTCPKCKKESALRLVSGTNFILKGGGWAADNYSSK